MREAKAIARQARVNSIDGASPVPSTSSTLSAASGSSSAVPGCSSAVPGCSSAVQGSSLADPKSSTAIPSCSTTVSGSSQAIPSCSTAVPESSSAVRGGPSANLGASTAVQGSSLPVTAVPESSSSDPISLTAVQGSWLADQSLNKAVPSSSSIVLGRSAVPGSLSASSSSPRAVKRSSPSATNGITVVANGTPSKNCLNLPINGNNSEKLDSITGTNPSNGDKETHISLIKQNSTEEDKSPAKPKQEKEFTAKLNSIAAAAHQPPAKATSLDSHLPSAKPNSQLLLQRLKSLESPVPLNLKIEALSSGI